MNSNKVEMVEFSKKSIFKELYRFEKLGELRLEEGEIAYEVTVGKGTKTLLLDWRYDIDEVFLYFSSDGEIIFEDWVDSLENESPEQFVEYLAIIADRYLNYETKVVSKGFLSKRHELQVLLNDEWKNILSPQ